MTLAVALLCIPALFAVAMAVLTAPLRRTPREPNTLRRLPDWLFTEVADQDEQVAA